MKWWVAVPVATRQRKHVFFSRTVYRNQNQTRNTHNISRYCLNKWKDRQPAKAKRNTHTNKRRISHGRMQKVNIVNKRSNIDKCEIVARIFYTSSSSKKVTSHKSFACEKAHKSTNSCMMWPHFFTFFSHFSIESIFFTLSVSISPSQLFSAPLYFRFLQPLCVLFSCIFFIVSCVIAFFCLFVHSFIPFYSFPKHIACALLMLCLIFA